MPAAVAVAALTLAACGSEPTAAAPPPKVAGGLHFSVGTPPPVFAHCGSEIPVSLTVTDDANDPVPGVLVNFHVATPGGEGSFWAGSGLTSATGAVKDYWTVGTIPDFVNSYEARAVDPLTGEKNVYVTQSTRTLTRTVFRSNRDGNWEIYAMDPDGGNQTRLTNDPGSDLEPVWSPDGTRIAFMSNRDGDYEIYTMKGDGSDVQKLTDNTADDQEPAWSPDGRQIAFQSNRANSWEIYTVILLSGVLTRYTTDSFVDLKPVFTSNNVLVWASTRDGTYEIYQSDYPNPKRLTNNPAEDTDPSYHNGTITFSSNRDGNREIYSMSLQGTNVQRLTNNPADDQQPAWTYGGRRIVFATYRDGTKAELYSMLPNGTDLLRLTNNLAHDNAPAVSGCTPY